MTKDRQSDCRIVPFPERRTASTTTQVIAATKAARSHALTVGTVGLILFTLATALMTAVIPLILFIAFLAWCGLMALLTAIDVLRDRLGLKRSAGFRAPIDHRALG